MPHKRSRRAIPQGIQRIRTLLILFVVAIIGLSYLGVSEADIGLAAAVFIWLIVGAVFSLLATALVEFLTGDVLKRRYLWVRTIRIGWLRLRLSISVFTAVSIAMALMIRYWLMS